MSHTSRERGPKPLYEVSAAAAPSVGASRRLLQSEARARRATSCASRRDRESSRYFASRGRALSRGTIRSLRPDTVGRRAFRAGHAGADRRCRNAATWQRRQTRGGGPPRVRSRVSRAGQRPHTAQSRAGPDRGPAIRRAAGSRASL